MRRRLTPEARRAEIVEVTKAAITEVGYRSLTMREVARRCGMSAPGMMHYFPDLPSLLGAVLDGRDEADIRAIVGDLAPDATLADVLDRARRYYASRRREMRAFDVLEAEALDPSHPAHEHFRARAQRTLDHLRPLVEREFADPHETVRIVRIILDGMRVERLRSATPLEDAGDHEAREDASDADWAAARRVIDLLPRRADVAAYAASATASGGAA
ncbi:TetR/AcrR family transcriptional regulator [Microbacterium ulmi]|uniref:TetR/AcrR family transcriptional regulator n=1 Tax=Microbacterium ulmi TaxID=179095 RepID=A0A7Y2Q033_9MICO|nr:TetR/AcrR family transcriptional regulator [Microbacterium ulmi]NII68878.1 AcrR family transcriptional regulator [Microbacterium ulmi]NNH05126.1 TetR/AcrR family transcriptional regulator [Microbacterium ulmi]